MSRHWIIEAFGIRILEHRPASGLGGRNDHDRYVALVERREEESAINDERSEDAYD